MDKYELDPSWRVVVLDDDECKLFFDQRLQFISYTDEVFGSTDTFEEWDDGGPLTHDSFRACSIPCSDNKEDIEDVKAELDHERLETFNSYTRFIQRLFRSYDVDHLILINDESFSTLLNVKRPETIAH